MPAAQNPALVYRPMTTADLSKAHALSLLLKWPHRLDDWAMLQRVAEGFVAEDNGRLVGTVFACLQGAYATIGLVIVSDEYQGQGIGRKLMELALHACGSATPLLNATLAGAPLYISQGFVEFGRVHQHQGTVAAQPCPPLPAGTRCREADDRDWAQLLNLANAGSGLDRTRVLDDLRGVLERTVVLEQHGQPCAFAMQRPFGRGRVIGPVVAQNRQQAQQLIGTLLEQLAGEFVRLDVVADCGLGDWLSGQGLAQVDSVAQMARGKAPQPGTVEQFALITQAIG